MRKMGGRKQLQRASYGPVQISHDHGDKQRYKDASSSNWKSQSYTPVKLSADFQGGRFHFYPLLMLFQNTSLCVRVRVWGGLAFHGGQRPFASHPHHIAARNTRTEILVSKDEPLEHTCSQFFLWAQLKIPSQSNNCSDTMQVFSCFLLIQCLMYLIIAVSPIPLHRTKIGGWYRLFGSCVSHSTVRISSSAIFSASWPMVSQRWFQRCVISVQLD